MVVAAAVEGHASYIVTEDPHLLDLTEYDGIKVMIRAGFAAELDRRGVPQAKRRGKEKPQ